MAKIDKDLALRIKGFVAGQKGMDVTVVISNAARKSPVLFDSALRLLEDIVVASVKVDKSEDALPIESIIAGLGFDVHASFEKPNERLRPVADSLLRIGTDYAMQKIGREVFPSLNEESKNDIFNQILEDQSPEGWRKTDIFCSWLNMTMKDVGVYGSNAIERFVDIVNDVNSPVRKDAYDTLKNMAFNRNYEALKAIFEFNTDDSYRDAKQILGNISDPKGDDLHREMLKIIFQELAVPPAYQLAFSIAKHRPDLSIDVIQKFEEALPAKVAATYAKDIRDYQADQLAAIARKSGGTEEALGDKQPYHQTYEYLLATYCAHLDPTNALNIIGRFKSKCDDVSDEKAMILQIRHIINSHPEQMTHGLNILLEQGTYFSLRTAMDMMLMEDRSAIPDEDFSATRQEQKKLLVQGLAGLPIESMSLEVLTSDDLLYAIAKIPSFANNELVDQVILSLAKKDSNLRFRGMLGAASGAIEGILDNEFFPHFSHYPTLDGVKFKLGQDWATKAEFAMNAIMKQPKFSKVGAQTIRKIANMYGDKNNQLGQQAYEYFSGNDSKYAKSQMELLVGGPTSVIPETTKKLTQGYIWISALPA